MEIEIKEDVKIGNIILEAGDKIKIQEDESEALKGIINIFVSYGIREVDDIEIFDRGKGPFLSVYAETGDRGPRTDHGGGDDGDDWMGDDQINQNADPFRKKWEPKIERILNAIEKEQKLKVDREKFGTSKGIRLYMDYGEKGHIAIVGGGPVIHI